MLKAVFFDFGNTIFREGSSDGSSIENCPLELMPDAREAIAGISLPKGLWANTRHTTSDQIRKWLVRAELDREFQWVETSFELGCRKPEPEFFKLGLVHCGLQPSEIVFVGNQLNSDILGGQRSGISTVYLADPVYRSVDDSASPDAKPTFIIQTLFELPDLVSRLAENAVPGPLK